MGTSTRDMGANLGVLPPEYNKAVHGPYDPAIFYGKKDVPLGDVKLKQVGDWIGRRNKSPSAIAGAMSRAYWRWNHKYQLPKYCGITPMLQLTAGSMLFFYLINYNSLQHHRNKKYHWEKNPGVLKNSHL